MDHNCSRHSDELIRHVVTFALAATNDAQRDHDAAEIRNRLLIRRDISEGLLALNVFADLGESPVPLVLISDYVNRVALNTHLSHPRYHDVVNWMAAGIIRERVIIDFEVT